MLYTAAVSRKNANQRRKDFMFLSHLLLLQVEESQLRLFLHWNGERLMAQLILDVVELHTGSLGRLELTCLSTIPGILGPEQSEYSDSKMSSVTGMMQVRVCLTYQNEKLTLRQGFPFSNNYVPVSFEAHTSVTLKISSFEILRHSAWQVVINISEEPSSGQKAEAADSSETLVTIYQIHDVTTPKAVIFKYVTH
jgi:hypothetical protein